MRARGGAGPLPGAQRLVGSNHLLARPASGATGRQSRQRLAGHGVPLGPFPSRELVVCPHATPLGSGHWLLLPRPPMPVVLVSLLLTRFFKGNLLRRLASQLTTEDVTYFAHYGLTRVVVYYGVLQAWLRWWCFSLSSLLFFTSILILKILISF